MSFLIFQRNHHTSAPHPRPRRQTAPTTICQTVTFPTHPHWTSRTLRRFPHTLIWVTLSRRRRRSRLTALFCATREAPCRLRTSSTTPTRTRRSFRLRHWRRKGSWLVLEIVMVLMNRRDILCETRRTFCTCFKVGVCG